MRCDTSRTTAAARTTANVNAMRSMPFGSAIAWALNLPCGGGAPAELLGRSSVALFAPCPFTRSCAARARAQEAVASRSIRVAPSPFDTCPRAGLSFYQQQQQQGYHCLLLSTRCRCRPNYRWRVHLAPRSNQGCPHLHQHRANRGLHRLCALVSDERILRLAGAEALGRNAVAQAAPKAEMGSMGGSSPQQPPPRLVHSVFRHARG